MTAWTTEIGSRVDDILSGKVETIPARRSSPIWPSVERHDRPRGNA